MENSQNAVERLKKQQEITLFWRKIQWTADELLDVIKMVADSNVTWEEAWTFVDTFLNFMNSQSLYLPNAVLQFKKEVMDVIYDDEQGEPILLD